MKNVGNKLYHAQFWLVYSVTRFYKIGTSLTDFRSMPLLSHLGQGDVTLGTERSSALMNPWSGFRRAIQPISTYNFMFSNQYQSSQSV